MNLNGIIDGLTMYLGLLVLLTFHEFGHAWVALRCGDDTAKLQGRCSLNPLVHLDLVGTVILPLIMIFMPGAGRFLVGWAKPVPVSPHRLRHPRRDDILVALAGPGMNVLLAVALLALARVSLAANVPAVAQLTQGLAYLSLMLCFFNLIPIPPLDGSHVLRNLTGMSYETYYSIARYGFLLVILVLQIPLVRQLLGLATAASWVGIASLLGVH